MAWLFNHTGKFPKHERFRLAKRIDDALFDFHKSLIRAVFEGEKSDYLRESKLHLQVLRSYLRLALELKYTDAGQFQYAAEHLDEIGKLLSSWMKKA